MKNARDLLRRTVLTKPLLGGELLAPAVLVFVVRSSVEVHALARVVLVLGLWVPAEGAPRSRELFPYPSESLPAVAGFAGQRVGFCSRLGPLCPMPRPV